jgi:cytochrome c biogenesis protein CcdA
MVGVGAFLLAIGAGVAMGSVGSSWHVPTALQERLAGSGIPGAAAIGALLGTVMSPCAGPALAVALTMAGTGAFVDGSVWAGIALLAAYSLGRGVVILAAGSLPAFATSLASRAAAWARWIPGQRVFGTLLALGGLWWMGQGLNA